MQDCNTALNPFLNPSSCLKICLFIALNGLKIIFQSNTVYSQDSVLSATVGADLRLHRNLSGFSARCTQAIPYRFVNQRHIPFHPLQPRQARFLCGESYYFFQDIVLCIPQKKDVIRRQGKVGASVWGADIVQFLAALTVLPRSV